MLKLIYRLGIGFYITYLLKINSEALKKIISSLVVIVFLIFFYSDLRDLLREINPRYLTHALIIKWILICGFSYLIFRSLPKLQFSERKLVKVMLELDEIKPELKEKILEIEGIQKIKDDLKKYRDIERFPKLKSELDEILKDTKV